MENASRNWFAVMVVCLLLATAMSGCSGSKAEGKTYAEFKSALGLKDGVIMGITKAQFIERVGEPDKVVEAGDRALLYYNIKGGSVTVNVLRSFWDGDMEYTNIGADDFTYAGN